MINKDLFDYDNKQKEIFGQLLCGVDEAGRGPLAGPVTIAAVILKPDMYIDTLNDSKKLSERQRDGIFEEIKRNSLCYNIVFVDNKDIDCMNILNATLFGMSNAIKSLSITPDHILIDGNIAPKDIKNTTTVIKGDSLSASIAAASVLAKVSRDRYMSEIGLKYTDFNFAKHKGYATKEHYEEIMLHGITPIHRKSFLINSNRYFDAKSLKSI